MNKSLPAVVCVLMTLSLAHGQTRPDLFPTVETEYNVLTTMVDADNGARPMWGYGTPRIVRRGSEVFASGLESIPGQ